MRFDGMKNRGTPTRTAAMHARNKACTTETKKSKRGLRITPGDSGLRMPISMGLRRQCMGHRQWCASPKHKRTHRHRVIRDSSPNQQNRTSNSRANSRTHCRHKRSSGVTRYMCILFCAMIFRFRWSQTCSCEVGQSVVLSKCLGAQQRHLLRTCDLNEGHSCSRCNCTRWRLTSCKP
jgi:hypothetical protein